MIKIAIIGLGHIGQIHLNAINILKEYELVAICDKKVNKYKGLIDKKVRIFSEYSEMLKKIKANVVVVATPNTSHFKIACDVIKSGLNVILEKPAANTIEELNNINFLSKKNRVKVYYAFHSALALEVQTFLKHYNVNKSDFGILTGFNSFFYDPYIRNNQIIDKAIGLENSWIDSGVNALSVVDKFCSVSNLEHIKTRVSYPNKNKDINSSISCSFAIKNKSLNFIGSGNIETAWDQNINQKLTYLYFGRKSKLILLDHSNQKVFEIKDKKSNLLFSFKGERLLNHYLGIFNEFSKISKAENFGNFNESHRIHNLLFKCLD